MPRGRDVRAARDRSQTSTRALCKLDSHCVDREREAIVSGGCLVLDETLRLSSNTRVHRGSQVIA